MLKFVLLSLCVASTSIYAQNDAHSILQQIKDKVDFKDRFHWDLTEERFVLPNSSRRVEQSFLDEQDYLDIERKLLFPWRDAWKKQESISVMLAKDIAFDDIGSIRTKLFRDKEGIREETWDFTTHKEIKTLTDITESARRFLAQFRTIDYLKFDTFEVSIPYQNRNKQDMTYTKANLLMKFDLRGIDQQGRRRHDRGTWTAKVLKEDGIWKLAGLHIHKGESISSAAPLFENTTKVAGLDAIPVYPRIEAIRRGGYALAIGDRRGKGIMDMYVGTWGKGTLLEGDGSGKFRAVQEPALTDQTLVKTAIFADFANKGKEDLALARFSHDDKSEVFTYANDGYGHYPQAKALSTEGNGYAMPAAVGDFNGDNSLDLYVGFPGKRDFTFPSPASENLAARAGENTKVQGLFLNDGHGNLDKKDDHAFSVDSPKMFFPHSAMAVDYDHDGNADLVVADDRGNLTPVFKNMGHGEFKMVSDKIGVSNHGFGMGFAAGDLYGEGRTDFVLTNIVFTADYRLRNSLEQNWSTVPGQKPALEPGLRLFKNMGNGKFVETTNLSGLDWAGEGIGGVELVDYNNDGLLDIYVTNGLWSGTTDEEDISSLFVRSLTRMQTWERGALGENPRSSQSFREASVWLDVLSKYQGNVSTLDSSPQHPSMAGFQRNRLFRNNGDGTFTDVAYVAGVDSESDGYVVATADFGHTGQMDLVLRNGDPGTLEHSYPPVEIYRNHAKTGNALEVKLVGTKSNHDAIGASGLATIGKQKVYRQLIANNGAAQSEHLLHFGMGKNKSVARLEIQWPSGTKQVLRNLKPGLISLVEPTSTKLELGTKAVQPREISSMKE